MKKAFLGALALAAAIAVPGVSFAATYAYVNNAGEVMTMEAADPFTAIRTAPNIDEHSGVLLVDDSSDSNVVGDKVPGV